MFCLIPPWFSDDLCVLATNRLLLSSTGQNCLDEGFPSISFFPVELTFSREKQRTEHIASKPYFPFYLLSEDHPGAKQKCRYSLLILTNFTGSCQVEHFCFDRRDYTRNKNGISD